jgi:seryl-tRNA synthetase
METVKALELFEELKEKFGEETAKKLIAYIDSKVSEKAATREDIINLKNEIFEKISETENRLRAEFRAEINGVKGEIKGIKEEISELRSLVLKILVPIAAISSALGALIAELITK